MKKENLAPAYFSNHTDVSNEKEKKKKERKAVRTSELPVIEAPSFVRLWGFCRHLIKRKLKEMIMILLNKI